VGGHRGHPGDHQASAHTKFRQAVEEWEAAVKRPIVTDEIYGITGGLETRTYNRMPAGTSTPDETAAYLDKWAAAHAQADGRDVGERPVSGGLARMTPLVELMHLPTGQLFEKFPAPRARTALAQGDLRPVPGVPRPGHRTRLVCPLHRVDRGALSMALPYPIPATTARCDADFHVQEEKYNPPGKRPARYCQGCIGKFLTVHASYGRPREVSPGEPFTITLAMLFPGEGSWD
jgi:hypothetical protein